MFDLRTIVKTVRSEPSYPGVLATVVHVKGSAYRRPGARMLIREDGSRIGAVSGGCLEGELVRKAWWWTAGEQAAVRIFDTTSDDDAVWAFGLGCNGVIEVMLERVSSPAVQATMSFIGQCHASRKGGMIATVIRTCSECKELGPGDRLFYDADGSTHWTRSSALWSEWSIVSHMKAGLESKQSFLLKADSADIFIEWVGAPQKLVIFGAGHDAIPVYQMAVSLGWDVHVADGRPAYAQAERFPQAASVKVIPPTANISDIVIDEETAVVMMTHNFPQDVRLLQQILPRSPRYLGLLGPKKRTERLFAELRLQPGDFDLHAPVGLDLGGDSAEHIALSVIAEVQAVLSGRNGLSLRSRHGSIHDAAPEVDTCARVLGRMPVPVATVPVCEVSSVARPGAM